MKNLKVFTGSLLIINFLLQTASLAAQYARPVAVPAQAADVGESYKNLLRQTRDAELDVFLEKMFGADAGAAASVFDEGSEALFEAVTDGGADTAGNSLERAITERRESIRTKSVTVTPVKKAPSKTPARRAAPRSKKVGSFLRPPLDWRQLAFGFQPLQDKPEIKMTETDKEIKAEGSDKKSFETKEAKGTRTQKVETKYTKDGKTFGVEIKDTQIIEAVSKPDGKSFRREISLVWGAEVAACPDAEGVTAGTGKAKVISKTIYSENGVTVTMTSDFDLQAKLRGVVNDLAQLTHYDLQVDAYVTNSGYEDALQRGLIKEIKIKDGRYGLGYDIPGNTIEISDGKYGGKRTPAKMGQATAKTLTPMSDAETTVAGSAFGPMVPSIWNSANEMYVTAQRSWRNNGCVEVLCKAAKTTLKQGESISISTETSHLQDGSKVNAKLEAEGYPAQVSPETQNGTPGASFEFTNDAEEGQSTFEVKSISKRGIGEGTVEFQVEKEKNDETAAGVWTGTIKAERKQREEREKRSGANLAENGGYLTTTTNVQLQLTGRIDRSVDATNAYIADVSGVQEMVDHEYDRYKVDEGYCGPNAVPYKGPKEITRTSTTTANYNKQTRAYVEIGGSGGTITFSLPEINGTTVHKYVHTSPCAEHDRANTNEAVNEDVATTGGSFSFSFPVDRTQKTIKGSVTVREEDGSTTTYSWELTRNN